MKKNLWMLSAVLCLAIAACAQPAPATQGTADDEVTIRGMAAKYAQAFNANDVPALAQMVSDDFESVGADGVHTKGRAAFQQMEEKSVQDRQAAGLRLTLSTATSYMRWVDPTHAVIGGTYSMAGLPLGAPDKGAWIVVTKKDADGKWLMANSLVAEMAPPPPPPPPPHKGK
jgi:uncharacterized protein (TIGR02246 family)